MSTVGAADPALEEQLRLARLAADAAGARLRSLQRITAAIATALRPTDLAEVIAETAEEAMGVDNVVLWARSEGGERLEAVRPHRWPAHLPTDPVTDPTTPHWRALLGDAPVLLDRLAIGPLDEWVARRMDATGHQVVAFVAFRRGERVSGVVSFGFRQSVVLAADDLALLQAIADQAAAALERAELFAQQQHIALALQRSLLPAGLPDDGRAAFVGHYLPAANANAVEVGGDWYDAMWITDDVVGLVCGDVVGRGLSAAVVMGQLRSAARALLQTGVGPRRALEHLDHFSADLPDARSSTVVCGQLDLVTGELRYSCAGHVPPLLVGAGGARFLTGGRGVPLGIRRGGRPDEAADVLRPGDVLYLYTDGLVERRGESIDVGLDRLAAELADPAGREVDELTSTLASGRADDSCLLQVRYRV